MKKVNILAALVIFAITFKGGNLVTQEGLIAGKVMNLNEQEIKHLEYQQKGFFLNSTFGYGSGFDGYFSWAQDREQPKERKNDRVTNKWSSSYFRGSYIDSAAISPSNSSIGAGTLSRPGNPVWTSGGPAGGDVNSIAIAVSNPDTIYAGTISGVYKSTDAGNSWLPAGLQGIEIEVVLVDPLNAEFVFAGANIEDGFFMSSSGGTKWLRGTIDNILSMDVDPGNPKVLWAGTSTGSIWMSTNRGEAWWKVAQYQDLWPFITEDVPIHSILVDPGNTANLFAGTQRGFLKSRWGAFSPYTEWYHTITNEVRNIAITQVNGSPVIYAMRPIFDLYKSTDLGESWTPTNIPYIHGLGGALTIDPVTPEVIYVGTRYYRGNIFRSTDSGSSWSIKDKGLPDFLPRSLSVNPQTGDIFLGMDWAGLYKSTDKAENWTHSGNGINNAIINDIAICPSSSETVFAALKGHIQKSTTGGKSWTQLHPLSPTDISAIAIDLSDPARMFSGTVGYNWLTDGAGRLYRTGDGGENWTRIDTGNNSGTVRDIWVHPANSNIMLALKEYREDRFYHYFGGIRRSSNGGTTWKQVYNFDWPNCLNSDPNNPDIVYMGSERLGYVFRSIDAGLSWENISPLQHWAWNVKDIVIDPGSNVYAATTDYEDNALGGIWKWDQTAWLRIARFKGTDVTALAIDSSTNPLTLYAGTSDSGVFVSQDGGESWSECNNGLEIMNISRLEISSSEPKMLYAGTKYGGVWAIQLESEKHTVSFTVVPEGAGTVTGEGTYNAGEEVTLTIEAAEGFIFINWTDPDENILSDSTTYTFTMPASDVDLTANLELAEYTVTVTVVPEGAGKVSGESTYNAGDEVTLEVVANEGYDFINWTDSAGYEISGDPVYTFTMPAEDVEVIANMDVINFTGLADRHPGPGITLFPNPATDEFVVLSEEKMNFIELAGYNGRVVYNREVNSREMRIPTRGFQGGVYFVRIHTDRGVYFKKVLIMD